MKKPPEEVPEKLTINELADLGGRLSQAIVDLRELKEAKKDAVKEMNEGIEKHEKEVYRLANEIRDGQRSLPFSNGEAEKGKAARA